VEKNEINVFLSVLEFELCFMLAKQALYFVSHIPPALFALDTVLEIGSLA
jgi:hypothetical protein